MCYFENGFEDDIFIETKFGQESLDKMILTNFLFDTRLWHWRISSLNHLFVLYNHHTLFRSKKTVKELINELKSKSKDDKKLHINNDFDNEEFHSLYITDFDYSPFIFGIDKNEKKHKIYNYD